MQKLTRMGSAWVVVVTLLVVDLGVTQRAAACKCAPSTVESSYGSSSDVVTVEQLFNYVVGNTRYYWVHVLDTYKGCLDAGQWLIVTTPTQSATCGVKLSERRYLISGDAVVESGRLATIAIGSCAYNVPLSQLTEHDKDFLARRNVCCGADCACADGSAPVNCLVDPCSVAPACSEGTCQANYCGGCHAEFYDDGGHAVCQEPAPSACESDADCEGKGWCRQQEPSDPANPPAHASYECVPFANIGDACGGFTLPWFAQHCAPGMVCELPDDFIDAPGICR